MANGKSRTLTCRSFAVTNLSNISQTLYLSHDIKTIYSKTTCNKVK